MGSSFESDERHRDVSQRPLRVPARREEIFREAQEMAADMAGWQVEREDADERVIVCRRAGGLLQGSSRITIRVEGPEGLPSATVSVRSETEGGLFSRDRANVQAFMKPFHRRVC